jgi:hypothetical protein
MLLLTCAPSYRNYSRADRELILNIRSAWLLRDGDLEAKKFAATANLRLEVNRYTEDPEHAHSQPSWRNYVLAYDGELVWLSDGSFHDNPGNIRIASSSRLKNVKGQSLVWLSIHNQEAAEEIGEADALETQDSQEESLVDWTTEKLVVVTESGSLASYGDGTVELRSIKIPGVTMLLDLNLEWKSSFRRHLRPLPPLIRPVRTSLEKITFRVDTAETVGNQVLVGWRCPLCVPWNFGSWLRLQYHLEREHPDVEAKRVDLCTVRIGRTELDLLAGEPVLTSSRVEPGTLADRLDELAKDWRGGDFEHLVREREEVSTRYRRPYVVELIIPG